MPQLDFTTYPLQVTLTVLCFVAFAFLSRIGIHRMLRSRVTRRFFFRRQFGRFLRRRLRGMYRQARRSIWADYRLCYSYRARTRHLVKRSWRRHFKRKRLKLLRGRLNVLPWRVAAVAVTWSRLGDEDVTLSHN